MASGTIASLDSALQILEQRSIINYRIFPFREAENPAIMLHKLRGFRTFLLCSKIVKRTEDNNDRTDMDLGLFVRIEGVISRISRDVIDGERTSCWVDIESLEEDMDQCYTSLSDYLQQSNPPVVPDQVWDIANSIIENLGDFLSFHRMYVGVLVEDIEALKESIIFLRYYVRFGTLLCADQRQEFHHLLTLLQPLAVSTAHLTAHLFSATHYNFDLFPLFVNITRKPSYDDLKSKISSLLMRIKPTDNPRLYETYSLYLAIIKNSRELCVPILKLKDFIAFLLSSLWEMLQLDVGPVVSLKDKFRALYEGLRFLAAICEKQPNKFDDDKIRDITRASIFDIGVLIFSLHQKDFVTNGELSDFLKNIQVIRAEFLEEQLVKASKFNIPSEERREITAQESDEIFWTYPNQVPSQSSTPVADEFVGFDAERDSIMERLERGSKALKVVAIVGMPGSGKTTLARKVYNGKFCRSHFHVRAWCSISQVFDHKKTLVGLINHVCEPFESLDVDEHFLAHMFRKRLLGRRYLIVIDDVWDFHAFHCLTEAFPDMSNGSRILLTSRQGDLVPESIRDGMPLLLPQLTIEESLELLKRKMFPELKDWPLELHEFGMEVAEYCKGLPLTVVIVAGLLKTTGGEAWKEVLESLRCGMASTVTDECKNSIELSYKHLSDHLKLCFLSFAAFPEDHVVSVKRLIWQWIAEGFVQKHGSRSLEEVATEYLNILIARSLVIKESERSIGGVRACRIHDLLHAFCLRKGNEEHFLHVLREETSLFDDLSNLKRLSVHSNTKRFKESRLFCPHLRTLLFFQSTVSRETIDMSFIFRTYKVLRVLAMHRVGHDHFLSEVGLLGQLRYLAIQVGYEVRPPIGNLTNLETLILYGLQGLVKLPDTFWNLQKLRHLLAFQFKPISIEFPMKNLDRSCNLVELESLSTFYSVQLDMIDKQLRKFPNIRQLECTIYPDNASEVISFSFLSRLESLSLRFEARYITEFVFPESIKKLILDVRGHGHDHELPLKTFSSIAEMPGLEVLKLLNVSFIAGAWHVEEEQFTKLKFLKLKQSRIAKWTSASEYGFPKLEKLVLEDCRELQEIPECLENAASLQMIEATRCRGRVATALRKVEEIQNDMGNSDLHVHMIECEEFLRCRANGGEKS